MMTLDEKVDLLTSYENCSELTNKHFKKIVKLSNDKDTFIRSRVAALLVNFKNNKSKKILLKLACDKKALVRLETYDSLSIFDSKSVERFLEDALQKEKNKLACYYAILSWADVVMTSGINLSKKCLLIRKIKKRSTIKKSEHCLLGCCYAQYLFGKKKALYEIIHFLGSKDYHIRCATVNTLQEIIDDNNRELIRKAMEDLLVKEKTVAVRSSAKQLMDESGY